MPQVKLKHTIASLAPRQARNEANSSHTAQSLNVRCS
jgi:hypothetical protein